MITKKNAFLGLTLITLIGFNACKVNEEPDTQVAAKIEPIAIRVQQISQGILTGNGEEGIENHTERTIQTSAEWFTLVKKMNTVNETIAGVSVDFDQNTVIAYFDEVRPSGGFTVTIGEVIETETNIQVACKLSSPEGSAIEIMTQPYHIIAILKTTKPVRFVKITE